jgi:integrase
LPNIAVKALRMHKAIMTEEEKSSDWIFCDLNGNPLRRSNFRKRSFLKLLELSKLPKIRFHDLRHSAATLLLAKGVHPKVVQERLGHSQISITLGTYSHVLPSLQKDAVEKIDEALKGEE